MTSSKLDDCRSIIQSRPGEEDLCAIIDARSKRDLEAKARALRSLDVLQSESGYPGDLADTLERARDTALVFKAANLDPEAMMPDEVEAAEAEVLDEIAGAVGQGLVEDGWTASTAHTQAVVARGIAATLQYQLGRLRGRMPAMLNAAVKRQARLEPRPPNHRPVMRSEGWQSPDGVVYSKSLYTRRASVRPQALGPGYILTLHDWSNGKATRMRLLDNLDGVFPNLRAALDAGDSFIALDPSQGGADVLTEDEYRALTMRDGTTPDALVHRANVEARLFQSVQHSEEDDMGLLAQRFRNEQAAIDRRNSRLVPKAADARGFVRRGSLVARDEPSLVVRGHASQGVDSSTGRPSVVFAVGDVVRRSIGLPPRPGVEVAVERSVHSAVAQQSASGFNDPGRDIRRVGPPGVYCRELDCYFATAQAMADALSVCDGAPGARPFRDPESLEHTRNGSNVGLFGSTVVAAQQAAQRGLKGNPR